MISQNLRKVHKTSDLFVELPRSSMNFQDDDNISEKFEEKKMQYFREVSQAALIISKKMTELPRSL